MEDEALPAELLARLEGDQQAWTQEPIDPDEMAQSTPRTPPGWPP